LFDRPSVSVTTIYLVRHAHADWSPDDDRPLSAAGMDAAQRVSGLLSPVPVAAIYTSPSRRAMMTVAPLARTLALAPELLEDLRERALPTVPIADFQRFVQDAWHAPEIRHAGESNREAQARGLRALRQILSQHDDQHVVVATHGNLLALMLNACNSAIGLAFWQGLSFPDVYRLEFERGRLRRLERRWDT
jgi:2,3-bisphosphoglycerate-dependent phosphoglycerate mutase